MNRFMFKITRIVFITFVLVSSTSVFALASETKLASADPQCIGVDCAPSISAVNSPSESLAEFTPSPSRLLLAGIVLLAVRVVAKKILTPKPE